MTDVDPSKPQWSIGFFGQNMKKPDYDELELSLAIRRKLKEMDRQYQLQKLSNFSSQLILGELRGAHSVLSDIVGLRQTHPDVYQWWQANLY